MTLFFDRFSGIQEEYLKESHAHVDPQDDDEVDYSNDDIGENNEVTPLGDEIKEDEAEDLVFPDDDEDFDDDDDVLLDDEDMAIEEEDEEVVDILAIDGDEDEDEEFDEDDDLFSVDDDDDFDIEEDDEVADLDEEEETGEDRSGSVTEGLNPNFEIHHPERRTGRMTDHEPGVSGFNE